MWKKNRDQKASDFQRILFLWSMTSISVNVYFFYFLYFIYNIFSWQNVHLKTRFWQGKCIKNQPFKVSNTKQDFSDLLSSLSSILLYHWKQKGQWSIIYFNYLVFWITTYPLTFKTSFRRRLGSLIFYFFLNFITNFLTGCLFFFIKPKTGQFLHLKSAWSHIFQPASFRLLYFYIPILK